MMGEIKWYENDFTESQMSSTVRMKKERDKFSEYLISILHKDTVNPSSGS